jgi:hypothetical protein
MLQVALTLTLALKWENSDVVLNDLELDREPG